MVGVLVVGFVANLLIRPVHERFHVPTRDEARRETAAKPQLTYSTEEAR
jgi:hypothetical protein